MPVDEYVGGLVLFAITAGSALGTAALVVRRRLVHLAGSEAVLAGALVASAVLIAEHLLPGLVGLLSRASAAVCALAILTAAAVLLPRAGAGGGETGPPTARSGRLPSWAMAGVALVLLASATAAAVWSSSVTASTDVDTLTFHLPNIARWIQTGTFWRVDQFTPLLANGNYPHNGDVIFLAAVLPWDSDAFVRALGVPFVAVAGLSVYAIAVRLGSARATAALFATLFASIPIVSYASHEGAKTDPVMLACFGAGLLFMLRHLESRRMSDLVLAGLGLGLAFGTKWYGVSSVAAVGALWIALWLWDRRPTGELLRSAGVLAGVGALAGGFWLLRNWVESGNPVAPTRVAAGGLEIFDAPTDFVRECGGYTVAHYVTDPGIWREYILPAYRVTYGLPGLLLVAGWVLGVAALARGRSPVPRAPLFLALAAVLLAVVYSITPYSALGLEGQPAGVGANTRWLLPAFLVAAPLAAWAATQLPRVRLLLELAAVVAVADGVRRGFSDPAGEVAVAGLALAAAAGAVRALRMLLRRAGTPDRAAWAVVGAVVVAALAVVGHQRQQTFYDERYRVTDPVAAWFAERAPTDRRVALAGVWGTQVISPVLPAFGPRLGNEVAFAGEYVRGQLREYERRSEFLGAVDRGGYDLLVVGRDGYGECQVPGREGDEDAWVQGAGYEKLAESRYLTLYRVPA